MGTEDWDREIAEHPLESQDPAAWLRYGTALLERIEPEAPDRRRQQQQAALAFLEALRCGASTEEVAAAQRGVAERQLREALRLAELDGSALLS